MSNAVLARLKTLGAQGVWFCNILVSEKSWIDTGNTAVFMQKQPKTSTINTEKAISEGLRNIFSEVKKRGIEISTF